MISGNFFAVALHFFFFLILIFSFKNGQALKTVFAHAIEDAIYFFYKKLTGRIFFHFYAHFIFVARDVVDVLFSLFLKAHHFFLQFLAKKVTECRVG